MPTREIHTIRWARGLQVWRADPLQWTEKQKGVLIRRVAAWLRDRWGRAGRLGQLRVYGRNGRIQFERTYGRDPKRRPG